MYRAVILTILLIALPRQLPAEELRLTLNPQQTEVQVTLETTLQTVHAIGKLKAGEVVFDTLSGIARGSVIIDAKSVSTGSSWRDRVMHKRILESAKYPEIVFETLAVNGTYQRQGKSSLKLYGNLKMHGNSEPMVMPLEVASQSSYLSATSNFRVPYTKFGIRDPSILFLRADKELGVTVKTSGQIATP